MPVLNRKLYFTLDTWAWAGFHIKDNNVDLIASAQI
jgi:hypothetical protein